MDESLDTLWNIGYVEKIAEDGDVLTYAYRFDSQDEEDNGIIQFDGVNWSLMDPTFAANAGSKQLKSFIGDGSNYVTKYNY